MAEDPRAGHGFAPGRHEIDFYGQGGLRFAGMSHKGSILALPSGIVAWPVVSARDLRASDLAAALAVEPKFDFLLIGSGPDIVLLSP